MKWQNVLAVAGLIFPASAWANSSSVVNFGNVQLNTQSNLIYTITNDAKTPIKLTAFDIGGAGFSAEEDGCETLAAGAKCQVEITFWPTFEGFQTGEMIMKFSDANDELDFDLQGWGMR